MQIDEELTEYDIELTEYDIELLDEDDGPAFEPSNPLLMTLEDPLHPTTPDPVLPTMLEQEPVVLPRRCRLAWAEALETAETRIWIRPYAALG